MGDRVARPVMTVATLLAATAVVLPFAGTANAQTGPASSGGITLSPASGSQVTLLSGTTTGPCSAAGANALQVVVTGPGPFAPSEAAGRPEGVALAPTTVDGFSTRDPNTFTARATFIDFAREVGLDAVPIGDYVIEFRCVDKDLGEVFQTYRAATLKFTTPTSYTVTGNPAVPTPVPPVTPPVGGTPTPTPTPKATATPGPAGDPTPAPTPAGAPTPTPDATPAPTPTGEPTPTPTAAADPAVGTGSGGSGSGGSGSGGSLPFTGAPITSLAAGGGLLVAAGTALLLVGRRRRRRGSEG